MDLPSIKSATVSALSQHLVCFLVSINELPLTPCTNSLGKPKPHQCPSKTQKLCPNCDLGGSPAGTFTIGQPSSQAHILQALPPDVTQAIVAFRFLGFKSRLKGLFSVARIRTSNYQECFCNPAGNNVIRIYLNRNF